MGLVILTLIILWGWAEVTAFIIIGGEIGGLLTFIGVFLTAVVGLWLLRSQAANVMANLRHQVTRGEAPLAAVAESLSLLIGGILMLIPGYVTDGLGLLLFVPGLRTIVGLAIMSRLLKNARFRSFAGTGNAGFHNAGQSAGDNTGHSPKWSRQQRDDVTIIEGEAEEKVGDPSQRLK
jgi:UPF0716 protein FxsA